MRSEWAGDQDPFMGSANAETRKAARQMAAVVENIVRNAPNVRRGATSAVFLGRTRGGSPRHPLVIAYDTAVEALK